MGLEFSATGSGSLAVASTGTSAGTFTGWLARLPLPPTSTPTVGASTSLPARSGDSQKLYSSNVTSVR